MTENGGTNQKSLRHCPDSYYRVSSATDRNFVTSRSRGNACPLLANRIAARCWAVILYEIDFGLGPVRSALLRTGAADRTRCYTISRGYSRRDFGGGQVVRDLSSVSALGAFTFFFLSFFSNAVATLESCCTSIAGRVFRAHVANPRLTCTSLMVLKGAIRICWQDSWDIFHDPFRRQFYSRVKFASQRWW